MRSFVFSSTASLLTEDADRREIGMESRQRNERRCRSVGRPARSRVPIGVIPSRERNPAALRSSSRDAQPSNVSVAFAAGGGTIKINEEK